eukprot:GHVN01060297.1.p1 GENE.GHVN01060297.1~~GHVN01060297.1.p1  ORF type:complete len:418 (+),score=41.94 GHVN01060297.1:1200-2453(+)
MSEGQGRAMSTEDEKSTEKSTTSSWVYRDDFGKIQGPFEASEILTWVQDGFFDRRGDLLFKGAGKTIWERLDTVLPLLMESQYVNAFERLQIDDTTTTESSKKTDYPVQEDKPFKFPRNLDRIGERPLFRSSHTCDVEIFIHQDNTDTSGLWPKPNKILKIPAHASILKVSSPVFLDALEAVERKHHEKMTRGEIELGERKRVDIVATNPEAVRVIIRWLYGFRFETSNIEPLLLLTVMREAKRLKVGKLVELCRQELGKPADVESMVQITVASHAIGLPELLEESIELLSCCSYAVFSSTRYLALPAVPFVKLLRKKSVMIDEIQLLLCAQAWVAEHEASTGIFSQTGRVLKPDDTLPEIEIISCVQFDSMSVQQLQDIRVGHKWDGLLLDTCLRKLQKTELEGRVAPWKVRVFAI